MKNLILNLVCIFLIGLFGSTNAQWIPQNSPSQDGYLSDIFALDQDTVVAVGSSTGGGIIIKTTDGGENWLNIPHDPIDEFSSVYFINSDSGWTVGLWNTGLFGGYGVSCKTTDAGNSWTYDTIGYVYGLNSVYFTDRNNGWVVGGGYDGEEHRTVLYSTNDGGVNWYNQYPSFYTGVLSSVYFVNKDTGFIAGQWSEGAIFKTTDEGGNWTSQLDTAAYYLTSVFFTNEFVGWAVGIHGLFSPERVILNTTDGGNNWIEQQIGTIDYLNDIYFINSDTGWVVGSDGLILHTSNGGMNWEIQSSGTNNDLYSVCFIDGNTGWAVGENGTILKTTNGGTIPVELTSFTAIVQNDDIELNWITGTETNNQGFAIERSSNGGDFASIDFVQGNGTTTRTHTYSYTDKNLHSGKYYYRLKQIDFDGSYEYSNIVEVNVNSPIVFSLRQNYPNPFNPITNISYTLPAESQVKLSVYNPLGELVETIVNEKQNAGKYEAVWNAANHSSGVYIYSLDAVSLNGSEHIKISKKMILLR